jgi:hypothetical protein
MTSPIDVSELTFEQLGDRLARLHRQTTELAARLAGISFLWAESRQLWQETKTEIAGRRREILAPVIDPEPTKVVIPTDGTYEPTGLIPKPEVATPTPQPPTLPLEAQ